MSTVNQPEPITTPPIDGITSIGIAYRRVKHALIDDLQVAWDAHPDCPTCGELRGQRCVMILAGRPHYRITPHAKRLLLTTSKDD
jgi:hypothetical protein